MQNNKELDIVETDVVYMAAEKKVATIILKINGIQYFSFP
jgi:hypothetical protein